MTTQPRFSVLIYRSSFSAAQEPTQSESANSPQDINRAARDAAGEFLLLAPAGSRLTDGLLARSLETLEQSPGTLAVFPAHTAGDAMLRPLAAQGPFRPVTLMRRNPVGPVAMIRRVAWEELGGLRTGLSISMALWDFWLRLVLAHPEKGSIRRLPAPLAHCPAQHAGLGPESRNDGRAKALLVVHTPGAFEADVCRWAMALLRGEDWARPHAFGLIPTAAEVRRMWEGGRRPRFDALRQTA